MTFQYVLQIKEYLTNTLHAVFGKLIKMLMKYGLTEFASLVKVTGMNIGAIIDGLIETALEKERTFEKNSKHY